MPIRFRCPVCEGLLSIATRKAGTKVVCPKCGDDITVPDADLAAGDYEAEGEAATVGAKAESVAHSSTSPGNGSPTLPSKKLGETPLFERIDIDKLLETDNPVPIVPTPAPLPDPTAAQTGEDGVFVSRGTLVVLAILVIVLIALAFATGFLIGS